MTRIVAAIFTAFIASGLYAPALPAQTPAHSIKIGYLSDLSGVGAYWGKQSVIGAKLAAADLKKEGLNVELVIGDHAFSTKTAVSEIQKQIAADKIEASYVEFAPTSIAVSPILLQHKLLFVSNSAAASFLSTNPYAFKAYLDYEKGCREVAAYWKSRGITSVGMIKANAEFAELCYQGARQIFPAMLLATYNLGEDVPSQTLVMKEHAVQAIINPGLENDALNMLKALAQINFHVPVAVAEPDGATPQVLDKYREHLDRYTTFGFPGVDPGFIARLLLADPGNSLKTIEAAAMAYVHIRQIANALAACPQADVQCQVKKLSASKPDPALQFVGWKNRIASYDFTLKEWKDGKLQLIRTFN